MSDPLLKIWETVPAIVPQEMPKFLKELKPKEPMEVSRLAQELTREEILERIAYLSKGFVSYQEITLNAAVVRTARHVNQLESTLLVEESAKVRDDFIFI